MWRVLSVVGTAVVAGSVLFFGKRASASSTSSTEDPVAGGGDLAGLPTAADVPAESLELIDLERNWGDTPIDLRPLFALMEVYSGIVGSARIFAVIAYRESRFVPNAHNGNAVNEQAERDDSLAAFNNNKDRNPTLRYGKEAGAFGSGGLFGALAPYFLWTGVPEVSKKAPLLNARPESMFEPRVAAFGACVYLQRILANYRVDDHADIKVGWANPGLLGKNRGTAKYTEVRERFLEDASTLGIHLDDPTIPAKLSASGWPGVPAVFKNLVGTLPVELT